MSQNVMKSTTIQMVCHVHDPFQAKSWHGLCQCVWRPPMVPRATNKPQGQKEDAIFRSGSYMGIPYLNGLVSLVLRKHEQNPYKSHPKPLVFLGLCILRHIWIACGSQCFEFCGGRRVRCRLRTLPSGLQDLLKCSSDLTLDDYAQAPGSLELTLIDMCHFTKKN